MFRLFLCLALMFLTQYWIAPTTGSALSQAIYYPQVIVQLEKNSGTTPLGTTTSPKLSNTNNNIFALEFLFNLPDPLPAGAECSYQLNLRGTNSSTNPDWTGSWPGSQSDANFRYLLTDPDPATDTWGNHPRTIDYGTMGVALTPDGMFASAFDPGDQQCVDGIMLDPKDAGMELGWEQNENEPTDNGFRVIMFW